MYNQSQKRILLIDDDVRIRMLLKRYLEKEDFIVEEASFGMQALQKFKPDKKYDLVVLDRMLPDMNGFEICKVVKQDYLIPVIILSEQSEEIDRIEGFKAGADDYVAKPFSPREVVLRIHSILNRLYESLPFTYNSQSSSELLISKVLIQPALRKVCINQQEVHLTPKEYDLLYFLAKHQERAFSREELLAEVWKSSRTDIHDHRTVDTHVKRLRDKLCSEDPQSSELIQTLWGFGYVLRNPRRRTVPAL